MLVGEPDASGILEGFTELDDLGIDAL